MKHNLLFTTKGYHEEAVRRSIDNPSPENLDLYRISVTAHHLAEALHGIMIAYKNSSPTLAVFCMKQLDLAETIAGDTPWKGPETAQKKP